MTPLSQRKVAEHQKNLLFLSILKDFYPRILTSSEKLPVWKEVLDECRINGICDDQSARYLGRTRWPALLRATTKKWKHRHKKQLNKKDELIIEIERMRIPDFCFPLNDDEEKEGKPKENVAAANKLAPVFEFYNSDNVFAKGLADDDPLVDYHSQFIDYNDVYAEKPGVNDLMGYDPNDIQDKFNDNVNVFAEEHLVDNSKKEFAADDMMVDYHALFVDNDDVYLEKPAVNDLMAYYPDNIHDKLNDSVNVFADKYFVDNSKKEFAADDPMVDYHSQFIDNDEVYLEKPAVNDLMAYYPDNIHDKFNDSVNVFAEKYFVDNSKKEFAANDPMVDYHSQFIDYDDVYAEKPSVNDLMCYDPNDIQDKFNDNVNVFAEEHLVDNSKKEFAADDMMVDYHAFFVDNDGIYAEKPGVNDLMAYDYDEIQDKFSDSGNVFVEEYAVDNSGKELAVDDPMVEYHSQFIDNDGIYAEKPGVNDLMAYDYDDIQDKFSDSGNVFVEEYAVDTSKNEIAADDIMVDYHSQFIDNDGVYAEKPSVNDYDDIQDKFSDSVNVSAEKYVVDTSKNEIAADDIMVDNHAEFIDDVYVEKPDVNDLMAYDPDDIQDSVNVSAEEFVVDNSIFVNPIDVRDEFDGNKFNDNVNVSAEECVVDNSISTNPIIVQNGNEFFHGFSSTTGLLLPMLFLPESFEDHCNHLANGIQSTDVHYSNLQNDFYRAGIRFFDLYAEYGQLKLNMMHENLATSDNNS